MRLDFCVLSLRLIKGNSLDNIFKLVFVELVMMPLHIAHCAEIFEDAGCVERRAAKLMDLTKRQMGPDTQQHSLRKYGPSHHFYCFNAF